MDHYCVAASTSTRSPELTAASGAENTCTLHTEHDQSRAQPTMMMMMRAGPFPRPQYASRRIRRRRFGHAYAWGTPAKDAIRECARELHQIAQTHHVLYRDVFSRELHE
eukprot:5929985-Pleurochrysis_carterae.AAC.1